MGKSAKFVMWGYLWVCVGWLLLGALCGYAVLGVEPAEGDVVMPWMLRSCADAVATLASMVVLVSLLRRQAVRDGDKSGLSDTIVAFLVATLVGAVVNVAFLRFVNGTPVNLQAFALDVVIRCVVVPTALAPAIYVIWRRRREVAYLSTLNAVVDEHERTKRGVHDILHGELQSELLAAQMLISRFRCEGDTEQLDRAQILLQRAVEGSLRESIAPHRHYCPGVTLSTQLDELAVRFLGPGGTVFATAAPWSVPVDEGSARSLWLLVNEALCNAVKHGIPGSIRCEWAWTEVACGSMASWKLEIVNARCDVQAAGTLLTSTPPRALEAYAALLGATLNVTKSNEFWRVTASGTIKSLAPKHAALPTDLSSVIHQGLVVSGRSVSTLVDSP